MNQYAKTYDAVALFSGGLDSILAVKMLEEQGLNVKSLHFVTPFFGNPGLRERWEKTYGLDLTVLDIGQEFVDMLLHGPEHGYGKTLNPCVDCKILLLRRAAAYMRELGARFLVTGEVLGQRPMSQRRDTLNCISREAGVRDVLLRPLCARCLPPTPMEESGLVDRERLGALTGRGRKGQYALAAAYGITDIPTPAGGCRLAERENARAYWPLLTRVSGPKPEDFMLANAGRQYWSGAYWLTVGRNQAENAALLRLARPTDLAFKTAGFPGPVALGRVWERPWPERIVAAAAAFAAAFSPKAVRTAAETLSPVQVRIAPGGQGLMATFDRASAPACGRLRTLSVCPDREANADGEPWKELDFHAILPEIRGLRKTARPEAPHSALFPQDA